MIRKAGIDDLNEIVDIHLASFGGFFLSSLGPRFLKIFYKEFLVHNKSCCLVSIEDERVVGFVVGVLNPSEFFRCMFKKRLLHLFLGCLNSIMSNPSVVIKLIRRAATYPGKSPRSDHVALLSSIAVLPEYHSKKIGEELVKMFLKEVKGMGADEVTLTTDKFNNDKVIAFYKKLGFTLSKSFVSYEGREMYEFTLQLAS